MQLGVELLKMTVILRWLLVIYFVFCDGSLLWAKSNCCTTPNRGTTGAQGQQGAMGPVGSIGPAGPVGAETFAFVTFVYSGIAQVVAAQDAIVFPSDNIVRGNISYDSTTGIFTLIEPGNYYVRYGVSGSPNNDQVALRLNSDLLPIPGSPFDIQSSILQGISDIFNVSTPMSTLRAINNEAAANITISASNSGSTAAYLLIQKL
jgi:hypothetical protein